MALVTVAALVASVSVSAQVQRGTRPARGFWYVMTPGESFAAATQRAAMSTGGSQVAATINTMLERAVAGRAVYVPQGTRHSVIMVRATVPELRRVLSAAQSVSGYRGSAVRLAGAVSSLVPFSFEVRGTACNPVTWQGQTWFTTWCDLPLEVDGGLCDPTCHTVDKLRAKITTNPGSITSRASYTLTNTVTTGYPSVFTDDEINWNTLCYRSLQECGHGSTGTIQPGNGTMTMDNPGIDLHGDKITHLYYLWTLFIPNGNRYSDNAGTGTATCADAGSGSNQCYYPSLLLHR
ncbi:MAG TPA: hypothetical protein VGS62_03535 [Streptosporangiaceae bacterium]|nr:hypothetical protein [Streptosporangiaceae bacterium]